MTPLEGYTMQKIKDILGAIIGTFLGLTGLIFFLDFDTAPMAEDTEDQDDAENP